MIDDNDVDEQSRLHQFVSDAIRRCHGDSSAMLAEFNERSGSTTMNARVLHRLDKRKDIIIRMSNHRVPCDWIWARLKEIAHGIPNGYPLLRTSRSLTVTVSRALLDMTGKLLVPCAPFTNDAGLVDFVVSDSDALFETCARKKRIVATYRTITRTTDE